MDKTLIDLAPNSKRGLNLRSRLVAGSGAAGFGDSWPPDVTPQLFGALITAPVSWQPQRGLIGPRLAEVPAGFLLATGDQNPGYRRLMQQQGRIWSRMGIPVILAVAAGDPGDWARLASHVEDDPGIAGLELHLSGDASASEIRTAIASVRRETTLPLLAKLPDWRVADLAEASVTAGADALAVGTPPIGAWPISEAEWVEASVSGPVAFPFTLWGLRKVVSLDLGVPVVAAGGVQSLADAARCLELGAVAVQVRSLLWTDPAAVIRVADGLRDLMALDQAS